VNLDAWRGALLCAAAVHECVDLTMASELVEEAIALVGNVRALRR
jgi:hypothetical protein